MKLLIKYGSWEVQKKYIVFVLWRPNINPTLYETEPLPIFSFKAYRTKKKKKVEFIKAWIFIWNYLYFCEHLMKCKG